MLAVILLSLVGGPAVRVQAATAVTFTAEELLGKPTDTSITINIVPASTIEYHYQYGTESGNLDQQTSTVTATGGQPHEITISALTANTQYFYRMRYHLPGETDWVERNERSFWTQRAAGSEFVFTIISDSHAMYNTQYQQAIANIAADHPDFHIDLGDTFMVDSAATQTAVNNAYLAQRELLYLDGIGHSAAIFSLPGNHENEEGWNLDDSFSIARASIQARKLYYPTPIDEGPGGFYSGNTDPLAAIDEATYGDEYREDYYAWTWGDALFIVFDPFQYTMQNPYGATAGEGSDDPATGDRWNWSLGQQQYNWLKQVLENSTAKYKFMFAHHMLGGTQNYVRGGAVPAHMFEWGGYDSDGATWLWDTKRPGWGDDPIRQLMIDNHVSAFFHGHDHQYAYEVRDGIVYLSMPRPSTGLDFNYYNEANDYTERVLASPGHLRVTVTPSLATVEYVTSSGSSGAVQHSFSIEPNYTGPTHELTTAVDPTGGGTINPSAGTHTYPQGQTVEVTATPNQWYEFDHWSGACTGSGACSVTMDADKSVTAHFVAIPTHTLTLAVDPTGGGTTNPSVGVHTYEAGSNVNVTASANAGYAFDYWTGACSGSGACSVTLDADKTVTAHFASITYDLTIAVNPTGAGTTSPTAGVHNYAYGSVVNVTATPNTGYAFSSWSGCNSTSGSSCSVTMDAAKTVTANFTTVSGNAASAATPSSATATVGQQVVVTVNIDMSGVASPNNKLGSFTGSLAWDPAVLSYVNYSGPLGGFSGAVNTADVGSGEISFNGASAAGATGNVVVYQFTFDAVGAGTSPLNLEYEVLAAATTFTNLLPLLTITDGQVLVSSSVSGSVNGDGVANSTDALIILSADVGMNTSQFCPMNCGDVNGDGLVNSTDALIILSYDAGMTVPFPVGTGACPLTVTPPLGCGA